MKFDIFPHMTKELQLLNFFQNAGVFIEYIRDSLRNDTYSTYPKIFSI